MATPLEQYLEIYDDEAGAVFVQLDAAIRATAPELESAIEYRLLSYTVERDWRHWVCAVNATTSAVCLRFLWGVLLDDPLGVREALDEREHFLANSCAISADARATYGAG